MDADFFQKPEFRASLKKFETLGPLGVTAEDHVNIATIPPPELVKNFGKTRADLMSNADLLRYLMEQANSILRFSCFSRYGGEASKLALELYEKNLRLTFNYLKTIGRFPSSLDGTSTPEELVEKLRKSYNRENAGLQHRRSKGSGRGLR
ncbi:MAG: hypothetical protein Q8Q06_02465 [bacterium]|nr:hypothetical protein [bacterium]